MAIIRQIAVYDQNYNQNNHWKIDDIGVNDARNVSLSSNIRGQSNIQDALRTIDGSLSSVTTTANNKVSKTGDTVSGVLNFTQNQPLQFLDPNTLDKNGSIYHESNNNASIIAINAQKEIQGITKSNIFQIGVNTQGEPEVFVGGYALNQTNITVEGAWRKAITGSSKIARMMNVAVLSTTTTSISFNANEIKDLNIEIDNTDTLPSDYTWNSFAGPINVHGHNHQNKLSFLAFYPGSRAQNNNRTVNVLVQNITNQSIADTITVRTLWFAVHDGTNNI